MTNEDKERIEKAAFNYVPDKNDHYADELVEGYIAGATKERELISEQLKQERNKAIDDAIAIVNESTHWTACVQKLRSLKH